MSYKKYYLYKEQISYDGGTTWQDVTPSVTTPSGDPIGTYETYEQCTGGTPTIDGKFKLTLSDSSVVSAECNSSSSITQAEISAYTSTLTSAEIGQCVTSIGTEAFYNCSSLSSITIPNSITIIWNNAFGDCSGLTSIDIPDSVIAIDGYAFDSCRSLTSITVNATTPPEIGVDVFDNTNDCPIYVPAASLTDYQTAWSSYASRIQAIP